MRDGTQGDVLVEVEFWIGLEAEVERRHADGEVRDEQCRERVRDLALVCRAGGEEGWALVGRPAGVKAGGFTHRAGRLVRKRTRGRRCRLRPGSAEGRPRRSA
jgi:hypothetical protein